VTNRKGETKRQHYVPRMIVRNFSKDGQLLQALFEGKGSHLSEMLGLYRESLEAALYECLLKQTRHASGQEKLADGELDRNFPERCDADSSVVR
jgi:hypothetical protein